MGGNTSALGTRTVFQLLAMMIVVALGGQLGQHLLVHETQMLGDHAPNSPTPVDSAFECSRAVWKDVEFTKYVPLYVRVLSMFPYLRRGSMLWSRALCCRG